MPRVTAAITTHNRAGYIAQAIESVFAQTYTDYELIVVDDGSTDNTREVLAPYADRLRLVSQPQLGRAEARNSALRAAQGELIAYLDSDDIWLPNKLERQVELLDAHPGVGLLHGRVQIVDDEGAPLLTDTASFDTYFERVHEQGATYAGYALDCLCFTSATMMRTTTLATIGPYDASILVEDLDLYLHFALDSAIHVDLGLPYAQYRLHTAQTPDRERTEGHAQVCLKHLALMAQRRDIPDARLARRNFYLVLARCRHMQRNQREARKAVAHAVASDPRLLLSPAAVKRCVAAALPLRQNNESAA